MKVYEPWIVPQFPPHAAPPPPVTREAERLRGLGEVDPIGRAVGKLNATQRVFLAIHGSVLLAVAYHGYKRNGNSVPWGIAWAAGGLACPSVTMAFALTQGYAKKKAS